MGTGGNFDMDLEAFTGRTWLGNQKDVHGVRKTSFQKMKVGFWCYAYGWREMCNWRITFDRCGCGGGGGRKTFGGGCVDAAALEAPLLLHCRHMRGFDTIVWKWRMKDFPCRLACLCEFSSSGIAFPARYPHCYK